MPEATAPVQSAPAAPPMETNGSGVIPSLEERVAATFGPSEPADDPSAKPTPHGMQTESAAGSGEPETDAAAKARAERRAALAKLRDEERARVDAMAAIRERDDLRRQLDEEREKSKAYASYVDPKKLSKEQFFALAEQNPELTPQELGEWLRDNMTSPERAAAQAARREVDPKLAALEKRNADLEARLNAFEQSQQSARAEAEERHAAEQLYAFTRENSTTSPLAARFLEKVGTDQFYLLAQSAAQRVPPGGGAQAILDEIEENLAILQSVYSAETAETPQRRQATPTQTNSAAAQAPTHVSNTLAQGRSSVVDEDEEWAKLPFEERSSRLFR